MDLDVLYRACVIAIFAIAAIALPSLLWITVPYGGRHTSERWGPGIPAKLGWALMELPAPAFFLWTYLQGEHRGEALPLFFLALFQFHYLHRTFVFPFLMRGKKSASWVSSW